MTKDSLVVSWLVPWSIWDLWFGVFVPVFVTVTVFIIVSYIQELSEEFRRIFKDTKVQIIFKGCNTLKTLLMHPKDKIPAQLHQVVVYQ